MVAFQPVYRQDLEDFDAMYGLPATGVNIVPLSGAPSSVSSLESSAWVTDVDVDVVHAVAPNAAIDVYVAAPGTPMYEIFSNLVYQAKDDIILVTWGQVPDSDADLLMAQMTAKLAAKGIRIFAPYEGSDAGPGTYAIDDPACVAGAIDVGGVSVNGETGSFFEMSQPGDAVTNPSTGWSSLYDVSGAGVAAAYEAGLFAERSSFFLVRFSSCSSFSTHTHQRRPLSVRLSSFLAWGRPQA